MDSPSTSRSIHSPYYEVNKTVVENLHKRNSGISILDIRDFFLWVFTMNALPPTWVFVGNKPKLKNISFVTVYEEDLDDSDELVKYDCISVRKTPVCDIWDQYLLYGVQSQKRGSSHTSKDSSPISNKPVTYNSLLLTEEELQHNNYMVVKTTEHREQLLNEGFLFLDSFSFSFSTVFTDDDLVAIDCEMVETKGGRDELAHVSIVNNKGVLYDEYCHPEGEITDYRTEYSGITARIMQHCSNKFKDVQQKVFSILTHKPVILIGHSLENDLAVLKLVAGRVIDTAIRYRHPTPRYKHSLRHLSVQYLNRSIQNKNGGHDPVEDARTALDLVVFYVNTGLNFPPSSSKSRPELTKRNCLLHQINQVNTRSRLVFLGYNDYVMSVSQTSAVGDMLMLKSAKLIPTRLRSLGKSTNFPRFTYCHGIEFYFKEINQTGEKKKNGEHLNVKELISMFNEVYSDSMLCLLVMKKSCDDSVIGGHFYIYMNSANYGYFENLSVYFDYLLKQDNVKKRPFCNILTTNLCYTD